MSSARPVLTHTSVVVIGAGPAGLVVANRLHDSGIGCVLLEAESRDFIESRPRAGFMEEWAVRALAGHGLAERILVEAETQGEFEFRFDGERHTVPTAGLSGRRHFVYPQPRLVTDLIASYADKGAGDARFGVRDVRLDGIGGDRPVVSYTDPLTGSRHRVVCDYVAGCDGARGSRGRRYPTAGSRSAAATTGSPGWRCSPRHRRRRTAWSSASTSAGSAPIWPAAPRSPATTSEVPPGDTPDDWPHERVWHELRTRLAADGTPSLTEGPLVEKVVLDMHNYVVEPMSYGRLHLAGDSAHLIAPIAAKGMNLAIHDALLLADALIAAYPGEGGDGAGDDGGLAGYSQAALRRVWQYQEFSQWLSDVLHGASSGNRFRAGTARARLQPAPGVGHRGEVVRGPLHGGGRRALTGPWATATG